MVNNFIYLFIFYTSESESIESTMVNNFIYLFIFIQMKVLKDDGKQFFFYTSESIERRW